jgi:hypothetical protein
MHIENGTSAPAPSSWLSARGPAQETIGEFLARYGTVPARSRLSRVFGLSPLDRGSAHWYWTAVGELEVVATLDRMGADWRVFHGVPGPRSAPDAEAGVIDHLVVGPAGVFTVSTYNHAGKNVWVGRRVFVVDEHRLPYIRLAETDVGLVERALSQAMGITVTASAVITLVDPGSLRLGHLPADVDVVASNAVSAWLSSRARTLQPELVDAIATVAAEAATWGSGAGTVAAGVPTPAGADWRSERKQFEAVRRQVAAATIIRGLWTVGLAVLLGAVLVTAGILQLLGSDAAGLRL